VSGGGSDDLFGGLSPEERAALAARTDRFVLGAKEAMRRAREAGARRRPPTRRPPVVVRTVEVYGRRFECHVRPESGTSRRVRPYEIMPDGSGRLVRDPALAVAIRNVLIGEEREERRARQRAAMEQQRRRNEGAEERLRRERSLRGRFAKLRARLRTRYREELARWRKTDGLDAPTLGWTC
jgi:hypothetical protein